jgi:8-oxo-dGTP pyrophosphatase MutT (NUDIX family)
MNLASANGAVRTPDELLRLLEGHQTSDEREAQAKDRSLLEIRRLVAPFDEAADPVHVTASAVLVGPRGTVLHLHRRLKRWLQPGGHVDPGEDVASAARRESYEETGLDVRHPGGSPLFFHLDVHEAALGHTHLDLRYLLIAPDVDPVPLPGESPEAAWYSWSQAESMVDQSLHTALQLAQGLWKLHRDEWWSQGGWDATSGVTR